MYRFDAREESGGGGGTLDWIDASRGIPQFARTVLNVPEEMLAIARTRTSLAFYTGHAIVSSAGTPCKVTNDCREDSRRRVLNKDPRRLDYPRPSYLSHLFTCRFTHPVRRSTLRPWQPCGVPLLFEIEARGRWRRGSFSEFREEISIPGGFLNLFQIVVNIRYVETGVSIPAISTIILVYFWIKRRDDRLERNNRSTSYRRCFEMKFVDRCSLVLRKRTSFLFEERKPISRIQKFCKNLV